MELIRNTYSSCISVTISALFKYIYIQYTVVPVQLQANIIDATKQFNIQHLKSSNAYCNFVVLFVYAYARTSGDRGWRKKNIASRKVGTGRGKARKP